MGDLLQINPPPPAPRQSYEWECFGCGLSGTVTGTADQFGAFQLLIFGAHSGCKKSGAKTGPGVRFR